LFGVNHKSPEVQAFVVLSYLFGPGGTEGGEAPLRLATAILQL